MTAQIALLTHTGSTAKQIDSILVSITAVKADHPGAPCTGKQGN